MASSSIYSVYVVNKAGGLVYQSDCFTGKSEIEKQFTYPFDLVLKEVDDKLVVSFGEHDGIKVGHTLLAIGNEQLTGRKLPDGSMASDHLKKEDSFPVVLKFGKPRLTTNERIMLASMFHSMYAISCKLSPVEKSSGIELLESDSFKLHCHQTITGVKFIVLTDPRVTNMDDFLRKIHELYADFALKNPFYSLEMPIRCELFDSNLQRLIEITNRSLSLGNVNN